MWVRGLKRIEDEEVFFGLRVAPYVGAWIETSEQSERSVDCKSHPMWVRGLKQKSRYPHCKVWNVAPYVGAWIETKMTLRT